MISCLLDSDKETEGLSYYYGELVSQQAPVSDIPRYSKWVDILGFSFDFLYFHIPLVTNLLHFCRGPQLPEEKVVDQLFRPKLAPQVFNLCLFGRSTIGSTYDPWGYILVYWSFQKTGRATKAHNPRLPFIDVQATGYVLSPVEIAQRTKGRKCSNSPFPFTLESLGVTVAISVA